MVYVVVIDNNLRVSALYKLLHELLSGAVVYVDSVYLRSGHHAVAHLGLRKVESVLKHLHLIINLIVLRVVYARLYKIVEINL